VEMRDRKREQTGLELGCELGGGVVGHVVSVGRSMDTCPRSFLDLMMLWEHREDPLEDRARRVPPPDRVQLD
jgi:hypothetical protein